MQLNKNTLLPLYLLSMLTSSQVLAFQASASELSVERPYLAPSPSSVSSSSATSSSTSSSLISSSSQSSGSSSSSNSDIGGGISSASGLTQKILTIGSDNLIIPSTGNKLESEDAAAWNRYQKSLYYLDSFDPKIIAMPAAQRDFVRNAVKEELVLLREIVREAIKARTKFSPSVYIAFKYATKLIGSLIKSRREELKIQPRIDIAPDYFRMVADLMEKVLARSGQVKSEKGYTKRSVDAESLYDRLDAIFIYVQRIIDVSPVTGYLKWNQMVLYKDMTELTRHDLDLVEETADIVAQFRAIGYENAMFVARRLINLVRLFARGSIPDQSEV